MKPVTASEDPRWHEIAKRIAEEHPEITDSIIHERMVRAEYYRDVNIEKRSHEEPPH